jgi:hypothetical protein
MPPACAMAMARRPSVTVSMAEETMGRLRVISRVSRVVTSTAEGMTREWPGRSSTSSKVRASVNVAGKRAMGQLLFSTGGGGARLGGVGGCS